MALFDDPPRSAGEAATRGANLAPTSPRTPDRFAHLPRAKTTAFMPMVEGAGPRPVGAPGVAGGMGEFGRGLARGVAITAPEMLGKAAMFLDQPGGSDAVRQWGKGVVAGTEQRIRDNPWLQESMTAVARKTDDAFSVRGAVGEAGEMAVPSLGPAVAGGLLGAGIGAVLGGPIGAAGGAKLGASSGFLSSLVPFFGAQAQDTYERVMEDQTRRGADPEAAHKLAYETGLKTGAVEAGGELIADLVTMRLFRLMPSWVKKDVIKATSKGLRNPAAMLKDLAIITSTEVGTEVGQAALQAEIEAGAGVGEGAEWENIRGVIMPTAILSFLTFGGAETIGGINRRQVGQALSNAEANPQFRLRAAHAVAQEAERTDPGLGEIFLRDALPRIQAGQQVIPREDEFYQSLERERRETEVARGAPAQPTAAPVAPPTEQPRGPEAFAERPEPPVTPSPAPITPPPEPPRAPEERIAPEEVAPAPLGGRVSGVEVIEEAPTDIDQEAAKAEGHVASEGQRESGNYRKGHIKIGGLDVSIENEAGTKRRPEWPVLRQSYGYVRGTEAKDGDEVDVFIEPGRTTEEVEQLPVFVVDQAKQDGKGFDEHKVMLGFEDIETARNAYLSNYTPGWKGLKDITQTTFEDWKAWLNSDQTKKAFAPSVKKPPTGKPTREDRRELTREEAESEGPSVIEPTPVTPDVTGVTPDVTPELPTKPQEAPAPVVAPEPEAPTPAVTTPAPSQAPELTRQTFADALRRTGAARVGDADYSIQTRDDGSYYYRKTEGGVRYEKGPGGPAERSRDQAIEGAALEAFGRKAEPAPTPAPKRRLSTKFKSRFKDENSFEVVNPTTGKETRVTLYDNGRARAPYAEDIGLSEQEAIEAARAEAKKLNMPIKEIETEPPAPTPAPKPSPEIAQAPGPEVAAQPEPTGAQWERGDFVRKAGTTSLTSGGEVWDTFERQGEQWFRLRSGTQALRSKDYERRPGTKTAAEQREAQEQQKKKRQAAEDDLLRDFKELDITYERAGVERLERNRIKPEGLNLWEWVDKLNSRESKFVDGRKTQDTGLQVLSKKNLWTDDADMEALRKGMLAFIRKLRAAPGYSPNTFQEYLKPQEAVAPESKKPPTAVAVPKTEKPTSPPAKPAPTKASQKKAARFRDMADRMDKEIEDKSRPMTQNATPKRLREYQSRLIDAGDLGRVQLALRAISDGLEAGTLPDILKSVAAKARILSLVRHRTGSTGYYDIHDTGEYADTSAVGKALQALIEPKGEERAEATEKQKAAEIGRLESKVALSKIPGYFPTSPAVAERMVEMADIEAGERVLEPSAGKGNIADAIRGARPDADISVIEYNYDLAEVLRAKGYDVQQRDFLLMTPKPAPDVILQNPPFEKGQDIDHVRHAYEVLKPGGRLISIVSEGPFFRSDKKATAFREWLDEQGGTSEKLGAGELADKKVTQRAGVAGRIVTMEKAEVVPEAAPEKPEAKEEKAPEPEPALKKPTQAEVAALPLAGQKKWLLGEVEEAAKAAKTVEELGGRGQDWTTAPAAEPPFVRFEVPGDGIFKVLNVRERLQDFAKAIRRTSGFTKKKPTGIPPHAPGPIKQSVWEFMQEGEWQNAYQLAEVASVPHHFGQGREDRPSIFYIDSETIKRHGTEFLVGRTSEPGRATASAVITDWQVLHKPTGLSVETGNYPTKVKAMTAFQEGVGGWTQDEWDKRFKATQHKRVSQDELRKRFEAANEEKPLARRATGDVRGSTPDKVRAWTRDMRLRWARGVRPSVDVVSTFTDLPQRLRDLAGDAQIDGVYDPDTQTVWLVADRIPNKRHARRVLAHESIGHHAMEQIVEDWAGLQRRLEALGKTDAETKALYARVDELYPDAIPLLRTKEVLALAAEQVAPSSALGRLLRQVRDAVRRWLVKTGIVGVWTSNEIDALVADAGRYLEAPGKPAAARALPTTEEVTAAVEKADPLFARTPSQRQVSDPHLEKLIKIANPEPPSKWRKHLDIHESEVRQGLAARFDALDRLDKEAGVTDEHLSSHIAARMSTSPETQMWVAMVKNGLKWTDGEVTLDPDTPGLLEILQPVADKMDLFTAYLAAKRATRLLKEGKEKLITPEMARAGVALGQQHPEIVEAAEQWYAFNSRMVDFAQEAGYIDPESRAMWEESDYVPFYRLLDEARVGKPAKGKGLQTGALKRLRGSERGVNNILENMLMNTQHLISAGMREHALGLARDHMTDLGMAHKIPLAPRPALIPLKQIKSLMAKDEGPFAEIREWMESEGLDVSEIPDSALQQIQRMWSLTVPKGKDVVQIRNQGKPEWYRVEDPLLLRSLTAINDVVLGKWMEFFRGPKRLLTTMVTATPTFQFRNWLRDSGSAFVMARHDITPLISGLSGLRDALKKDDLFWNVMAQGGGFHSGFVTAGDPSGTRKVVEKELAHAGIGRKVASVPRKLWDAWMQVGSNVENANRLAIAKGTLAAGKSNLMAAFEAKDFMDFSNRGDWAIVNFLTQTVPFLNARIQGNYRLYRGAGISKQDRENLLIRANPKGLATHGLLLTLAGLALWWLNKDDDRYKELEDWDKDTHWHAWFGDEHFKIPKPFEIGILFGTVPERAFDAAYNEGDQAIKVFLDRMGWAALQVFNVGQLPQTLRPIAEQVANREFFFDRPIEGMSLKGLKPEDRYSPWTHETSIQVGKALGVSPVRIDHLVRGYTGAIGNYVLSMADIATRAMFDYPAPPAARMDEYPVVRAIYADTPPKATKYRSVFYDMFTDSTQAFRSLSKARRDHDMERAGEILKEDLGHLRARKGLERVRKRISIINKQMRGVYADQAMLPDAKRERLNALIERKNALYKLAVERAQRIVRAAA